MDIFYQGWAIFQPSTDSKSHQSLNRLSLRVILITNYAKEILEVGGTGGRGCLAQEMQVAL